ncbi:hypothetical protein [Sphingomonas sp. PP-F2F-G114-C0414]|uniref:hypothetical protein n=1 Tax=Sphingomonas sp. PP-F2F-G114-C0414 TaxID=2135662 RepID=UPI000EF8D07A|nr:hypothetical protein [Sphingomonas sp. PP-F2F-G114-C0414]
MVTIHHAGRQTAALGGVLRPRRDIGFRTGGRVLALNVQVGARLYDRDLASRHQTLATVEARYARGDFGALPVLGTRQATSTAEPAVVRQRVASTLTHIQRHRALGG